MNLQEICKGAKTIGISGHIRPDGDCIGATTALAMYLRKLCPETVVTVYLEPIADIFSCIPETENILHSCDEQEIVDVFFCIDCDKSRLGFVNPLFERAKKTVNIDHHVTNIDGCAMMNLVDPKAAAASQIIFTLLQKEYMDDEIAKALYIGIIHDTGVFQYSNTTPETMMVGAELLKYRFDFASIIQETFYQKTLLQSRLSAQAVLDCQMHLDGRCASTFISLETMQQKGATSKDLDGVVNQIRNITGVICAIFIYELSTGEYKISMRSSKEVDVSKISATFGGGGHIRAAGCTVKGEREVILNNILHQIQEQLVAIGD